MESVCLIRARWLTWRRSRDRPYSDSSFPGTSLAFFLPVGHQQRSGGICSSSDWGHIIEQIVINRIREPRGNLWRESGVDFNLELKRKECVMVETFVLPADIDLGRGK
ncbi:hypothetical protein CEXT_208141 [Caerostris extrusa]|uniref:Uncharacterized protein n=1 Tax=Caerostris extrusa TaxID=172846 RepID=A0AAV4S1B6_CAEEX|nr:hypothetical protein CEXT_208141 [Caerostris extrusa]